MPRRSPRDDRKAGHARPGRNLSARARGEREQRRRSEAEAEEQDRLEQRRRGGNGRDHGAPSRPSPIVCPRGKLGYPEHVARAKLAEYAGSSRPNRPVRVYLCDHCKSWHLTSSPDRPTVIAPPAPRARPPIPPPPRPRLRPPSSGSS